MIHAEAINCPICGSADVECILKLNCGKFDGSTLYQNAAINICNHCGHTYNELSAEEVQGLMKYYNEEYAPLNMASDDNTGDRPGSANQFSSARYFQLYELMKPFARKESYVLDVGCAMGGYLDYLHQQGFENLFGIDLTEKYVDHVNTLGKYTVKLGNAESIPFDGDYFDCLVIDQVMEHLVEPVNAFKEANRVLRKGGFLCISVPDGSRYDEKYFFDFYWFIMREHIQHFDMEHLKLLAAREGFELIDFKRNESVMMSEKMILPNLSLIFRSTGRKQNINIPGGCLNPGMEMKKYVANDLKRLERKKRIIDGLINSKRRVYAWGIGREFLYLYENAGLKECNLIGLIDANPIKWTDFLIDGRKISDSSILEEAKSDSVLLITATAHTSQIQKKLLEIGYPGEVLILGN
jgi:SAM-dependent methyltransferase